MRFRSSLQLIWLTGCLLVFSFAFPQEKKEYSIVGIAFYNVENLYDYEDDPLTFDDDWTPEGKNRWTRELYEAKSANMARAISDIGTELCGNSPVIIGLAEIENRRVLEDLVSHPYLADKNYGIVHYDSPDRRGIDVALLYQKNIFTVTASAAYELIIYDIFDSRRRIFTRDQLLVSGKLDGEMIHIIVGHWPSRFGGETRSMPNRIRAAELNKKIIDSLFSEDPYSKIISMGDFNDDPVSPSIKKTLNTKRSREGMQIKELYNPMEEMYKKGLGTLAYRDGWNLFDQIIISTELAGKEYSSFRFYKAEIFNKSYLQTPRGKYKGYPFRSYSNGFTGGYSDHFPVLIYLIKEKQRTSQSAAYENH